MGVLGDGIAALACAHYLIREGLRPVVLSPSAIGGWMAERFPVGPRRLDCFHVPVRRSDTALCGLLADLDLLHRVVWREAHLGLYAADAQRYVQSPRDLWSLTSSSWTSRLRSSLLPLLGRGPRARGAAPGIGTLASDGPAGCDHFDVFHGWHHRKLRESGCPLCGTRPLGLPTRGVLRELAASRPRAYGYLRGGHRALMDALAFSIVARGGQLRRGHRLQAIEADARGASVEWDSESERFDALISTVPLGQLAKLARGPLVRSLPFPEGPPHAEISVVALARGPVDLPYLTLPFGGSARFQRVYNAARLLPEEERGGLHPVYLVRDAETHAQDFQASDAKLIDEARELLGQLGPGLGHGDIEDLRVFRTGETDLTWARAQLDRPPRRRIEDAPLYLCTAARPYARTRSADTSVMLARDTVSQLAYQI